MHVDTYLKRIGYTGSLEPTAAVLRELHRAHLLAVPFENLDIHLPRKITLDTDLLYDKIVGEQRGGFCFELNGLFAALLRELGFDVTLLSARVATRDGNFGPEFDHLLLRVDLDEAWLADVGFGDSFRDPLRLVPDEQEHDGRRWRVDAAGHDRTLMRTNSDDVWSSVYTFTLEPRALEDFAGMCQFHSTSPESHFTQKRIVTIATPEGRTSLAEDRLIVTRNGQREEEPLDGDPAWRAALHDHFGIVLPERVSV